MEVAERPIWTKPRKGVHHENIDKKQNVCIRTNGRAPGFSDGRPVYDDHGLFSAVRKCLIRKGSRARRLGT